MYKISSTGAVMNKRTSKILKHFLPKETNEPSVTLYRCKMGDVIAVQDILNQHFPGAELAMPAYKKQRYPCKKQEDAVDLFLED